LQRRAIAGALLDSEQVRDYYDLEFSRRIHPFISDLDHWDKYQRGSL
jgi:hypothetical protein